MNHAESHTASSFFNSLLAHVSPPGWEHITLTGEYRWPRLG
jgi:hypothetical protein